MSKLWNIGVIILIIGLIVTWGFNNFATLGSWLLGVSLGLIIGNEYANSLTSEGESK